MVPGKKGDRGRTGRGGFDSTIVKAHQQAVTLKKTRLWRVSEEVQPQKIHMRGYDNDDIVEYISKNMQAKIVILPEKKPNSSIGLRQAYL